MNENSFILAHDLGTTGNKVNLFSSTGVLEGSYFYKYETDYPNPEWAEQNPAEWKRSVLEGTRALLEQTGVESGQIAVVSFSGHMQGALPVDNSGEPLRRAIIWADQRAKPEAERLENVLGAEEVYKLTGNRISPAYTAAKVAWLKNNQPDLYSKTHKILQPKDFGALVLSGRCATDFSDASLTQLLDVNSRKWATPIFGALGIEESKMPNLYPADTVIGTVTHEAAELSGLKQGTPVVIGGGDGACATVGAGAVSYGDVYNYIGSSSWIGMCMDGPLLDPEQRTFNFLHLDKDLCVAAGTMQSAGGSFDWLEQLLRGEGTEAIYSDLIQRAGKKAPGGNSALFLPYLLGERSPLWNPRARGCFIGLSRPDGRGELTRVVLEGITFNLKHILEILTTYGTDIEVMRVIGGGTRSEVWRQIIADIYQLPLQQIDLSSEATALGAAVAGGVGVGLFENYSVVKNFIRIEDAEKPKPENRARYEALYKLFRKSYTALEGIFEGLSELPSR